MFGIKTKIINNLTKNFEVVDTNKSISKIETIALMHLIKQELEKESNFLDIQHPISKKANAFASQIIKETGDFMPNNLGNWSIKKPTLLSHRLEKRSLEIIKNYYQAPKTILGHFSSGSTEGNIYATWVGRNYLLKKLGLTNSQKKIALLKTKLSHYSLSKAVDLCQVESFEIKLDMQNWCMDENHLLQTLTKLYQKGYRGFLLPLTLGYTITGSDDNYQNINELIENFCLKHKNCKCFVWLDAAFSGVSKIFLEENFQPFAQSQVQLITADLHKFLAVPYPAGFILYRPNLLNYIKRDIFYIDQWDTTLLGSRPGISVIASWFSLLNLNRSIMQSKLANCLQRKEKFLEKIRKIDQKITIVNNPSSLQACLLIKANDSRLKKKIESSGRLRGERLQWQQDGKQQNFLFYKLYFFADL
ncbi:MAG: hypothetical protein GX559_02940 [Candidatus Pacebacteria bacterium]|nr:hypothetical protein [Candidatus Paceibacterota bacterium]